jgi:hypothetical protein
VHAFSAAHVRCPLVDVGEALAERVDVRLERGEVVLLQRDTARDTETEDQPTEAGEEMLRAERHIFVAKHIAEGR